MLTQCNKGYEFDLHTNLDGSQKWGWIKNKSKYRRLRNHLNNILNMQNTAVYYYARYTGKDKKTKGSIPRRSIIVVVSRWGCKGRREWSKDDT